jgi:hemoglobin
MRRVKPALKNRRPTLSHDDAADQMRRAMLRLPLHDSITEAHVDALVETFYSRIWVDERLGPIFAAHITDRPKHLATMKRFWSSVLLKTGDYKGRPVPTHMRLTEVVDTDFPRWLAYFRAAASETFDAAAAPLVIDAAERIAQSLWFAMFGSHLSNPPKFG